MTVLCSQFGSQRFAETPVKVECKHCGRTLAMHPDFVGKCEKDCICDECVEIFGQR